MTSRRPAQATFGMMLGGYAAAYGRLVDGVKEQDGQLMYRAAFEALNWAVALDDAIAQWWRPEGQRLGFEWRERVRGAELMAGVRFARNRVHHQWADALALSAGRQYPKRYPMRYQEIVWRPAADLPPPPESRLDKHGTEIYTSELAGRPAEIALHIIGEAFDDIWRFLELPGSLGIPGAGFSPRSFRYPPGTAISD